MAARNRTWKAKKPVILTAGNGPATWKCSVTGCGYLTHNDPGPTVKHRVSYDCPIHGRSFMLRKPHIGGSVDLEALEET